MLTLKNFREPVCPDNLNISFGLNPGTAKEMLGPYLRDRSAFINPDTRAAFGLNTALSVRTLEAVYQEGYRWKQGLVVFYEVAPRAGGARFVLRMAKPVKYLNGGAVWGYTGVKSAMWSPSVKSLSE